MDVESVVESVVEEQNQEGTLPFQDTLVSPGPNNSLVTTVYRKPTNADQYLHSNSNHFITAKNSFFNTLAFSANVVCINQHTLQKVMEHIRKALLACNFLPWALNNQQNKFNHRHNIHNGQKTTSNQANNTNLNGSTSKNISVVIPYIKGLGEKFKRTCNTLGIQVHFKGNNTI